MFFSRVSYTVRVRHGFKYLPMSLSGRTLSSVKWIHNLPEVLANSDPGSSILAVGSRKVSGQYSCKILKRFVSTTPKERLELDPKSDDESTAEESLSKFSEDGNKSSEDFNLYLKDEDLQTVTGGDPVLIEKVKYIQLEHELYRQEGMLVPSKIKLSRWKELLSLPTKSQRKKFYIFLFKVEMKQASARRKKEEERMERENRLGPKVPLENDQYGMRYGLGMNTIFHRFYDSTMAKHYHNKIFQAYKFGRPLVYDLGFDEHMTEKEAKNCAKQIELVITENKEHPQPFSITLCNAHKDLKVMHYLAKIIPTIYDKDYFMMITEKSYLDLFPKESIVYLSPNAKDYLEEFDEDDVYIVGAMVDKTDPRPLTLAKAKKEQLRLKKLPLDKYLDWGLGGKSLTLNQMNNILLDIRYTQDWPKSLRFVPTRKLRRDDQIALDSAPPPRRERNSKVYEDYELLNKRRGFQFGSRFNDKNKLKFRQDFNRDDSSNVKIRTIMRDDD